MLYIFDYDGTLRSVSKEYAYIFPWVEIVLRVLFNHHNRLTIYSTAHTPKKIKKELGKLVELFSLIVGTDGVEEIKPNSERILYILKYFFIAPKNTLFVGDTEDDIIAGKSAGVKTGAVTWGLGKEEKLRQLKPDYVFSCPKELILIEQLEEH